MLDVLWQLEGVTQTGEHRPRLDELSLTLVKGATAVIGPSGAGKSSLLNLLVEFERPAAGRIRGPAARAMSRTADQSPGLPVFWVPQTGGLWPHMTVSEHLQVVSPPTASAEGRSRILDDLDLAAKTDSYPDALSEGERGRLSVARALAAEADVLVMDEPLVNVDPTRARRYWRVISRHCAGRRSLVFATHSVQTVLREADQVVCLSVGRLLYSGAKRALYCDPASRELAELLGPANWFSDCGEAARWLCGAEAEVRCYRPERVAVEDRQESPLRVVESHADNLVGELTIHDERSQADRTVYHRANGRAFQPGDRVQLRVLPLLLLMLLAVAGCQPRGNEPTIEPVSVRHWSMPPAGYVVPAPRGVCIGAQDEVFVLDDAGRVLVFSAEGDYLRGWEMPAYDVGRPEGICQLADGRIAVADTHYSRVVFFDRLGEVVGMHGQYGREPGQFIYPVAIAQDDQQNYYVCEYGENDRVQKFSVDGEFVLEFGSFGTGPAQFQRPSGVVWHEGRVYVADAINNRVQVFSDVGEYQGVLQAGAQPPRLHYPYDMTMGADGRLYLVEYGAGRVTCLALTGELLGRWGQTGSSKGQLATPWGLAVGSDNRILVADTGNRRLVEVER